MFEENMSFPCAVTVVGVGGGGINAVNHMISSQINGIKFIAVDTDATALSNSQTPIHIQIDGKDPNEIQAEIIKSLEGSKLVFIVAGMGGNTGSRLAAIIAAYAKGLHAYTIAALTCPSSVEDLSLVLEEKSALGLKNLRENADSIITIQIDDLFKIFNNKFSLAEIFQDANEVLRKIVQGISNLIITPGIVNLDIEDIKLILKDSKETFVGIGEASGENACLKAAKMALKSPLFKNDVRSAESILISFSASEKYLTMSDVNEASTIIQKLASPHAEIMWGMSINESLGDFVRVIVIFVSRYRR